MTCTNEKHSGYIQPAGHASVHEIAAEATCARLKYGRELTLKELQEAMDDAREAQDLDSAKSPECIRMLGVLAAAQEALAIQS
jgi:hypothetical protein